MKTTSCLAFALLLACGGGSDDTVIPSTTKVLDPAAQATLVSYAPADGTLVATLPSALADLVPGDVVVCGIVADVAPVGFLRKVTGSTQADGQVIVTTEYAGLADAIDTGTLTAEVTPTADDLDMTLSTGDPSVTLGPLGKRLPRSHIAPGRGVIATFNDTEIPILGLTMNGYVAFDMRVDAAIRIENFRLTHFRFIVTIEMDNDLTLDGPGDLPIPGVGGDVPIYTVYFTPIVFAIGPVPVVITPRLVLGYGMEVSAQMTVAGLRLQSNTTAQVGTDYTPETGWVDHSFGSGTGSTDIGAFPRIGLTFDTYARAELAFMLYDVIGPYVWSTQGLIFDIATPRDPVFRAGVHVAGGLGGRIDLAPGSILNLVDFSPALLDLIAWFFASPNTPPFLTVANPLDGDYTQIGYNTPMVASAFDLEDGPLTDIHWSSDRVGDLGIGATLPPVALWGAGPGVHTITTSVTDSDQVTTTQVAHVTVLNQPARVAIQAPIGGNTQYIDSTRDLIASVTSPFVSGNGCNGAGWTFAWTKSNPADTIADPTACITTVTFHGAPGPRTFTFRATDPWPSPLGLSALRTVSVNAQPRPPTVFANVDITSPAPDAYDANSDGVLPAPFVLTGTVGGPPAPVGAITYTWSAVAYDADEVPGPELAVGTGNNLSWQPTSTPGLVDSTLNEQRIDIYLRVADSGGNTGSPDGEIQPITLRYAPE